LFLQCESLFVLLLSFFYQEKWSVEPLQDSIYVVVREVLFEDTEFIKESHIFTLPIASRFDVSDGIYIDHCIPIEIVSFVAI